MDETRTPLEEQVQFAPQPVIQVHQYIIPGGGYPAVFRPVHFPSQQPTPAVRSRIPPSALLMRRWLWQRYGI